MEKSLSSIEALVNQIKQEFFSSTSFDFHSFVSPSAYDTAWLAMVPHPKQIRCPKFKGCLDWVLKNQKEGGFWGVARSDGHPTIDTLPSTLVCMVALKKWGVGQENIKKGLAFIHSNSEMLLNFKDGHVPRWFAIVFPAMLELAQETGLEVVFHKGLEEKISNIFHKREQILQMEELVDNLYSPPLLSYIEALPPSCFIHDEVIVMNLSEDGSLFQSPSATVRAFFATGNKKCMNYLESLVRRYPDGVPTMHPFDEGLISLCMVNQLQRLGLAEYFSQEIHEILKRIYSVYQHKGSHVADGYQLDPAKIYRDSLAFRLLRMHGYNVSPGWFLWFLKDEDIRIHMERNCENFTSALYNVYRATDLMFPGEYEVEKARLFSKELLEKALTFGHINDSLTIPPNFHRLIEHELSVPWMARLEHLDHRVWIEENRVETLWIGKASFYRLSCLHNDKLMQVAVENFELRQSVYRNELEELKRWSKNWGLSDLGFGREKTTYCYFAMACSTSLPHDSVARLIVAKSAILVTVADDFFDMRGSLDELLSLCQAVERWDGRGLSGHGKIIFRVLDEFVSDVGAKHLHEKGIDIIQNLREMWSEAFNSWLMEATWSKSGYIPTLDEYLKIGMISIATHVIALPASSFLNPGLPKSKLNSSQFETITKLLMLSARLLNDIESYQKELKDGRKNLVMLQMMENSHEDIESSIAYVREILGENKKEFLKQALMDDFNCLPKSCKQFHLSCLKVFQMFFNSSNVFDSSNDLIRDIKKAMYIPLEYQIPKPMRPLPLFPLKPQKKYKEVQACFIRTLKNQGTRRFIGEKVSSTSSIIGCQKVIIQPKFNFCFV